MRLHEDVLFIINMDFSSVNPFAFLINTVLRKYATLSRKVNIYVA